MVKKSLKIKPAKNISHAKRYSSEGGLLPPAPPPPQKKKKNEGKGEGCVCVCGGGGGGQNSYKSWKYSSVSFLFLFLFDFLFFLLVVLSPLRRLLLPLYSCLPCHNLQDAVHPVPNFHLKIGEHPASCSIAKISNEWCIPSKQQRCHIFHVYAGFRDSQGRGVKETIFFDAPFPSSLKN